MVISIRRIKTGMLVFLFLYVAASLGLFGVGAAHAGADANTEGTLRCPRPRGFARRDRQPRGVNP
jgi:hypothetical protein